MKTIDGRKMAKELREELAANIRECSTPPKLGVLLVGNDQASHLYVNLKEKAAAEVGIETDIKRLPEDTPDERLEEIILSWNADPTVHGILIQLPLPKGSNANRLIATIDPKKDADGFHPQTIQALMEDRAEILSPVHEATLRMIAATGIHPQEKAATILANSETFAKPLAKLLQKAGFITAIMHPDELDTEVILSSNVLISAIGRPKFIRKDLVRPGMIIIDIGVSKDEHGTVCGDADAHDLKEIDGWITPVPGGIGPMTIALLLKNVYRLSQQ